MWWLFVPLAGYTMPSVAEILLAVDEQKPKLKLFEEIVLALDTLLVSHFGRLEAKLDALSALTHGPLSASLSSDGDGKCKLPVVATPSTRASDSPFSTPLKHTLQQDTPHTVVDIDALSSTSVDSVGTVIPDGWPAHVVEPVEVCLFGSTPTPSEANDFDDEGDAAQQLEALDAYQASCFSDDGEEAEALDSVPPLWSDEPETFPLHVPFPVVAALEPASPLQEPQPDVKPPSLEAALSPLQAVLVVEQKQPSSQLSAGPASLYMGNDELCRLPGISHRDPVFVPILDVTHTLHCIMKKIPLAVVPDHLVHVANAFQFDWRLKSMPTIDRNVLKIAIEDGRFREFQHFCEQERSKYGA